MKRFTAILLSLLMILSLLPTAGAEGDTVWVLEKIEKDGAVYWARDINNISLILRDDGSAEFAGLYFGTEESPKGTWAVSDDKAMLTITVLEDTYTFGVDGDYMGLSGEDRTAVFVRKDSNAAQAEAPADALRTLDHEAISNSAAEACPVEEILWTGRFLRYRLPDCAAAYTFSTDYGPYLYVVDTITGQVVDKAEADMDAARAQEGFREPLTSDEVHTIVSEACPLEHMSDGKISVNHAPDGNWHFTIDSAYGQFYYVVDGYTGEILDRVEPDMDAVRAQEDFKEPLNAEEAMDKAIELSGLTYGEITSRKVKKNNSDDTFTVTLGSPYGDFVYKLDRNTREVVEKTEPDVDAVKAQEGFVQPMDSGEAISIAEKESGLDFMLINNRKLSHKADGSWSVTLETVYGDFTYVIDSNTREILDRSEPDMEAARQQEGFKEPLSRDKIDEIALEAAGLKRQDVVHWYTSTSNGAIELKLELENGSQYYFKIDIFTGEILDRIDP